MKQLCGEYDAQSVKFVGDRVTWYRPVTLNDLLRLKAEHPLSRLLVGGTEARMSLKYFKNYT